MMAYGAIGKGETRTRENLAGGVRGELQETGIAVVRPIAS